MGQSTGAGSRSGVRSQLHGGVVRRVARELLLGRALAVRSNRYRQVATAGACACSRVPELRRPSREPHGKRVRIVPPDGEPGVFDWAIQVIEVRSREARGPQLTGTTREQGTDLPTIVDPYAAAGLGAIQARDHAFSWPRFQQRADLIFRELQQAWSEQTWERARAFVSDALHESQQYWIEMYKRAGLRNITENAAITSMELARVESDRYFDAITVRLFASGLDYTVDQRRHVVSGSKHTERAYSEYWTLIRSAERRGAAGTEPKCPNCGAELKINMAGHCEYCRAKVTTGEFDWVLSRIEQDDAYGAA